MDQPRKTRAELEEALAQQRAENAELRAALARVPPRFGPIPDLAPEFQQQDRLGFLIQEHFAAIVLTDASGHTTWVNKGFTMLCGLELAEVVGKKPEVYLRPHLTDRATLSYIEESVRTQSSFQYEVRNPTKDGWIRVNVQPVYNENHELVQLAGLLEDITDWKKSQTNLAESELRFQVLAENVPGVLYEWREDLSGGFRFNYVSPKLFELFGIPMQDVGRILDFIHPDDVQPMLQSIRQATLAQVPWSFEGRVLAPGQPLRWFRGSSVVTGHDATGVLFSGLLLDITPLKLAETALRESDLRWRLALDGFGDGIWERNFRTGEVFYSKDYKSMLGYEDEAFPNALNTWRTHVHPDDRDASSAVFRAYLAGEIPIYTHEHRLRCSDGTYKWVLSRGLITERDAQGQPLIFTGSNTDISVLKKAQIALEASSRQLSTVIANFQEGIVLEDESRQIVLTNEAFCRLLDGSVTPQQLSRKDGAGLFNQSKAYVRNSDQYIARVAALLHNKVPVSGDVLKLHDGRTIQRDFVPIYDHDHDRYIGQLWKFQDITSRIKAEEKLKQREEKYRGIIENMSLGLVEADLEDQLIYANQSFCDITGYCSEEMEGRRLSPLLLTGQDLVLVESKIQTRQQGIADSYEIAVTTKGGQIKWLLVSGAPLYDNAHQLIGSIGIYLDVTPQKQLEARLREAKALAEVSTRAKQDFLANMSHEIRTPMNAILGMSQLLGKTTLSAPQASYLHAITASAENLLVIINDILDLSKIEAGRMAVEVIGFSPASVCTQVEKTLLYKAEEKGLSFVTHIGPGVPAMLFGDPYRITQILLNLAGNAVKFTDKGMVNVMCTLLDAPAEAGVAVVEFAVRDTGVGIEAGYLATMFDDFSQEDSSVTRQFGGTGLGLGISKKLVTLLGGELRIESQKNQGTTSRFALRLPIASVADLPPGKDSADLSGLQQALRGKRILLVEDNTFNRMLATIFLTNAGLEVIEATNGQVAVEIARQQSFDLVLMDVQMPVMNGYEATAMLRQELGLAIPIIALTANAINGERGKCLAAGMNDYLTKPFEESGLISMVYEWVMRP